MFNRKSERIEKRNMDIKPRDKTIKELLSSGSQFIIPRFQREYSWDKKNYKEFLDDMLNCLLINDGKINWDHYFLGTMLFVGDCFEGDHNKIDVVDGQQRLTTITILFSALSDIFKKLKEEILSKQIFKYIMTKDDDGGEVRILQSNTHYPFFSFYIQDIEKKDKQEPTTEEEENIEETYRYLYTSLEEEKLRKFLKKKHGDDVVDQLKYIDILKALRDQVLKSTFVSISTTDRKQANMIFEILNAKGKNLSHVDLIKNKIFEILNDTEPADYAEEKWKSIKKILNDGSVDVGFVQFYRYFWISKYRRCGVNKLYDDFLSKITSTDKEDYKKFLREIEETAKLYVKVAKPDKKDFLNRKEYYGIVQSMKTLSEDFNVIQVRLALISLIETYELGRIKLKQLRNTIYYLENFHFAYNAICAKATNKLENIYSKFSIKLRNSNGDDVTEIIDDLIRELDKIYVSYSEFEKEFINLSYTSNPKTNKDKMNNIKTKYAINKIASYYQDKETFEEDGSIEHILSESDKVNNNRNIGNLILLEQKLNNEADNLSYDNKLHIYKNSSYKWIKEFTDINQTWSDDKIEDRSKELAKFYYQKILGKEYN